MFPSLLSSLFFLRVGWVGVRFIIRPHVWMLAPRPGIPALVVPLYIWCSGRAGQAIITIGPLTKFVPNGWLFG